MRFRDVKASILPDSVDGSLAGVEEVSETRTVVEEEGALRPPNLVLDRDEAERAPESVPVRSAFERSSVLSKGGHQTHTGAAGFRPI